MTSDKPHDQGAGPPQADRLLIPAGMKPADVHASRIDAPIRRLSGATMGTGWSLSFAAPDRITNPQVISSLEDVFTLVIRQMSGWDPTSDLCQFNRAEPGWRELPPDFFHVLKRALEIAELTDGAYDPALGAKVDALGFGPSAEQQSLLSSRKREALSGTHGEGGTHGEMGPGSPLRSARDDSRGWRAIKLNHQNRTAWQPGGVTLDLSSIAKGHAVDLAAQALRALAIPSFLMEIGGEFSGEGVKPDGRPWWVELELSDIAPAPNEPRHNDVALVGLSVATSGDFIRRRDGISHLLDGRTGQPLTGKLCGVTVIHKSCMEADAWATALFPLGADGGLKMAEAQGLAALFAIRGEDGSRITLSAKAREMLG